ncbi:MAG: MarR family transcriptional regulator [Parasporobacterium sp.]|nr:MarR family transcriptional regulator [Parasporobacterium sp.]
MAEKKADISGLVKVFRMVQSSFGYFGRKYGLTISEMMILFDTFYQGKVTVTQLADSLGIPKSTVSRLVDHMVRLKYLDRIRPEDNRRIVQISVTDEFCANLEFLKDDLAFQQVLEKDLPRETGQKAIGKLMELVDILQADVPGKKVL